MSFERFLSTISKYFPGEGLGDQEAKALAQLNPEKIYVENVRSVLDLSARRAEQICETAVRQGIFQKWIEVLCPDDSVAASAESLAALPEAVMCWVDTGRGLDEVEMPTAKLRKAVFYRLVDHAEPARPHGQTA